MTACSGSPRPAASVSTPSRRRSTRAPSSAPGCGGTRRRPRRPPGTSGTSRSCIRSRAARAARTSSASRGRGCRPAASRRTSSTSWGRSRRSAATASSTRVSSATTATRWPATAAPPPVSSSRPARPAPAPPRVSPPPRGTAPGRPPPVCPTSAPVAAVTADTYVQSDLPATNFGTKTLLAVDNGTATNPGTTGVQRTFLRVSVSGVGARQVTGAHLRLQVAKVTNAQSVTGGRLHPISDCTWNERTVTWSTQPLIDGPALATLGAVAQGQTVDFDVSSTITGDGAYCFALDTVTTDRVRYGSRGARAGKPQVAVTTVCPCAPAVTTTTTLAPGATTTTTLPATATAAGTVVADTYVKSD